MIVTHPRVTPQQEQRISELYVSGLSGPEVAKRVGISQGGVLASLKRCGIPRRPTREYNRIHKVNERFFDSIDTEEKAYWLGFLTADGHVSHGYVQIKLARCDERHLKRFVADLESDYPIVQRTTNSQWGSFPSSGLSVGSVRLADALRRLGLASDKRYTAAPCHRVPKGLVRHYWRGLVDGDGHLWSRKDKKAPKIGLCGSEQVITGFRGFVAASTGYMPSFQPLKNGKTFVTEVSSRKATSELARILYGGASVYLSRKQEKAEAFIREGTAT